MMITQSHSIKLVLNLTLTLDLRDLMSLIKKCIFKTMLWNYLIQWWMGDLLQMEMRIHVPHQNMSIQMKMMIRKIAIRHQRNQPTAIIRKIRCTLKSIRLHTVNMFRSKNLMIGKSKHRILKLFKVTMKLLWLINKQLLCSMNTILWQKKISMDRVHNQGRSLDLKTGELVTKIKCSMDSTMFRTQ